MARADEVATACEAAIHFTMQDFGKIIFIVGLALAVVGAIVWRTGGLGGLGKLPGDIFMQKGCSSFYFPVVTCILISLALTLLNWFIRK